MSFSTALRNYSALTILLGCTSLAIANPAEAANFSNTNWNVIGNSSVVNPVANTTLTTDTTATPPAQTSTFAWQNPVKGVGRFGTNPNNSTTDESTSASLIWKTFDAAAGDKLAFNWLFSTQDTVDDFSFFSVSRNGVAATVNRLASVLGGAVASNPYSYSFNTAGTYTVGIGVANWLDDTGVSTLGLSNIKYTAIPTPALLPGLVGLGLGLLRKRKSDAAAE